MKVPLSLKLEIKIPACSKTSSAKGYEWQVTVNPADTVYAKQACFMSLL